VSAPVTKAPLTKAACNSLDVTVRRARDDELRICAALYERTGNEAFTWRPKNFFHARDFLRFAEEEEVTVAVARGAILGILVFFRPHNFIHCLYVDPAAQGFGIGTALIKAAEKFADGPLSLKVDEPNAKARAFYAKHGFVPQGETGIDQGMRWLRLRQTSGTA
jgi:GNAT superfamily N-acetyltransferase